MTRTETFAEALARLNDAIAETQALDVLAERRIASADLRIADADARIYDADQQTAHARSGMAAADAHMEAAQAHMADADARAARAAVQTVQARRDKDDAIVMAAEADRESSLAMSDSEEYQRALYHYQQLVRHRIANPLQIILGMAHTLLERRDLPEEARAEMIGAICDAASLLERLSLFSAEQLGVEESELNGRPFHS